MEINVNITGVEQNVFSRFVDYTKETKWEELISTVEMGVKKLVKSPENRIFDAYERGVELLYMGYKYKLKLYDKDLIGSILGPSFLKFMELAGVNKIILLAREVGSIKTPSQRRHIFSAMCCSFDNSHVENVFLASSAHACAKESK